MNRDTGASEVREFERNRCRLQATAVVSPGNADRVTFSRDIGDGSGLVRGAIVDCSHGGFAWESETFFPRAARVRVTVPTADGPHIELDVAVRRATMVGRKPLYNLGMSLVEPVTAQEGPIRRLLGLAKMSAAPRQNTAGNGGGAVA